MPAPRPLLAATACLLLVPALTMACGDDSASTTADRVVVISLNILHGIRDEDPDAPDFDRIEARLAIIGRALAAEKPDVVLLQEVFVPPLPGYHSGPPTTSA